MTIETHEGKVIDGRHRVEAVRNADDRVRKEGKEYVLRFSLPHPGDAHLQVVLARYMGQWVTWIHNLQDGGDSAGHYFSNDEEEEARKDYAERCLKYCRLYLRERM